MQQAKIYKLAKRGLVSPVILSNCPLMTLQEAMAYRADMESAGIEAFVVNVASIAC